MKAACYKGQNYRIRFKPFDGLKVRVRGRISLYEPRGEIQLLVESLEPVGEGALTIAFEQIKAKLAKEGLFDAERKRPLPLFPRTVGIVTSPNGAAFHDIVNVLTRRASSVNLILIPTRVQGEFAAREIADAIETASDFNASVSPDRCIDVLIVSRGGGSAEDLWAFNEEIVARAIRNSDIPVISAVGHEIDHSIADLAADLRAPTPSAAAELVAKAEAEIRSQIEHHANAIIKAVDRRFLTARSELQSLAMSPVFADVSNRVTRLSHRTSELGTRLERHGRESIDTRSATLDASLRKLSPVGLAEKVGSHKTRLAVLGGRQDAAAAALVKNFGRQLNIKMAELGALSPLSVLQRGYSITQLEDGTIVRDRAKTQAGERLNIRVEKGTIKAKVLDE
jgi:exodeoxyribonuclease VII large subunit